MAAIDSAIAVDQSVLTYGEQATIIANATSNASADASSVDGFAAAGANITDNSGLDQSSLIAGTGASVKVDVNGTAQADSATINSTTADAKTLIAGTGNTGGQLSFATGTYTVTSTATTGAGNYGTIAIQNGDLIVDPENGNKYYVVGKTEGVISGTSGASQTFQLSLTP